MFKSASWKSQKKTKVVFKMRFQATQVPKLKAKNMMISLVPADVGKPTVKLGKSPILEGTCSWENPVYETVKLVKERKTGMYRGKLYYVVVSTGSSKSGFLGEAAIDFVDFLEASNPVMIYLPLEPATSGALLHVTIQKLEGSADERYMEEDEASTYDYCNGSLEGQLKESDRLESKSLGDTQEDPNRITRLHDQSHININKDTQERMETSALFSLNDDVPGDTYQRYQDWSFEDTSDRSVTDITNSPGENDGATGMKTQIKTLERQAEVSEMELQSLRRQIAKETRKVQELTGKVISLNQERDTLKTECEQLHTSLESIQDPERSSKPMKATDNLGSTAEEANQELSQHKQLNKKLKFQLQKNEDSNSELILTVRDLKEQLERKSEELLHLSGKLKADENETKSRADGHMCRIGVKKNLEETVTEQNKAAELELLKQELIGLSDELELTRNEKEELALHFQQLTLDFDMAMKEKIDICSNLQQKQIDIMEMQQDYSDSLTTVKQLEHQEESYKEEIKRQGLLYSGALTRINELESEVKSLEKNLRREAEIFEDKVKEAEQAKVEQERRAIQAEEALRNVIRSKTQIIERLREELRKKSEEMTSKISDSEKQKLKGCIESEMLKKWTEEKEVMESNLCSLKKESEGLKEENINLRTITDEMKKRKDNLHHEIQNLRTQCDLLNRGPEALNLENKNQKKLVFQNVQKKDDVVNKAKEHHIQDAYQDTIQQKNGPDNNKFINDRAPEERGTGKNAQTGELNNSDGPDPAGEIKFYNAQSKRTVSHSRKELKMGSPQAYNTSQLAKLVNEIASLKEGKTHMEVELKEMQERYSEMSLRFAEVEGERQQLVMTVRNLRNGKKT